jgi:hypothetical protein
MGCLGSALVIIGVITLFSNALVGAVLIGAGALCFMAENSGSKQ